MTYDNNDGPIYSVLNGKGGCAFKTFTCTDGSWIQTASTFPGTCLGCPSGYALDPYTQIGEYDNCEPNEAIGYSYYKCMCDDWPNC